MLRNISSCVHLLDLAFEDRHGSNGGKWVPMDLSSSETQWRQAKLKTFADEHWSRVAESGMLWERVGGRGPVFPPNSVNFTQSMLAKWMPEFGSQPGNFRLMIKQSFNSEEAIHTARELGMEWILHIDVAELFYPAFPYSRGGMNRTWPRVDTRVLARTMQGGDPLVGTGVSRASAAEPLAADALPRPVDTPASAAFALPTVLAAVIAQRPDTEKLEFLNHEAKVLPAHPDGYTRRFEEALVFARNGHFRPPCPPGNASVSSSCTCGPNQKGCGKGMVAHANSFLMYTNGKSAAKITDFVQQFGPHDFKVRVHTEQFPLCWSGERGRAAGVRRSVTDI